MEVKPKERKKTVLIKKGELSTLEILKRRIQETTIGS